MRRPTEGIATDAAHSMKNGKTEYQAINLATRERIFYRNLGNQTTNIRAQAEITVHMLNWAERNVKYSGV